MRDQVIYQVFVRNYKAGTFNAVKEDLPRIKELGVDYVYLLPIHPIGQKERKGSLGSPYAITDYFDVNPELGSMQDFEELVEKIHEAGLKVMMDIVINHTAPDHPYTYNNPEFYYRNAQGKFANQVGDWSDIIDFDYRNQDLWEEMKRMFTFWVRKGVDGFRCDVAPFLPIAFWQYVRTEIAAINPEVVWLAESVHRSFLRVRREEGFLCHSDCEMYSVFDVCYDYDIHPEFMGIFEEGHDVAAYLKALDLQEMIYPAHYSKLHFLENHDQPRIHALTKGDITKTLQWLAYSYFAKGTTFVYNGQEFLAKDQPSLFDKDPIVLEETEHDLSAKMAFLKKVKQEVVAFDAPRYVIEQDVDYLHLSYCKEHEVYEGIFNVLQHTGEVKVHLADGVYTNLWNQAQLEVKDGLLALHAEPILLRGTKR
ncbi:MAG: alpha-amylase family glycosyl hydrolase [Erysipelotrichaceae bacterium]